MVYTKEVKLVEVVREGGEEVLKINYESMSYIPSIEDNPLVMMDAIDKLVENPSAARITFNQRRKYAYSYEQTQMLVEIANIYSYFFKSKRATSLQNLGLSTDPPELLGQRLSSVQFLLFNLLKQDPLAAYAELKRVIRTETINKKTTQDPNAQNSYSQYIQILEEILSQLEKTKLVLQAKEYLAGYTQADRDVYRLLFRPTISPDFMFAKLMTSPPLDAEQLDLYKLNASTDVAIYKTQTDIKNLYHITPPEFKISEDKFELIDLAKKVLAEHQPQADEFLDPEKMRTTFTNISKDLIRELAEQRGMLLSPDEVTEMAEILVRHTIGFGVVELLLEDEKVQDLTINSPMGQVPIFLLHDEFNECVTNITPSTADFESWTTKFRLLSGRPLDEANPILDTEIILPKSRSRLSVIGKPLNPFGFGMSFRRHRDTPWTLPLFIKNGMLTSLAAGLLSFTIQGARAHLIAGTRSSGKCLKGEELVQLADGRLLPIKDIVEENLKKEDMKTCDDGYYAYTNGLKIITADEQLKLVPKEISCVWKRTAPKDLYEIQLRSGKKITTTAEHPVLAMDPYFFGYKKSEELKKGMRIATPRNISLESAGKKTLDINISDYPLKTNAKKIRLPDKITPELLEFLGYILGDGHVFNGGVHFINENPILQERFNYTLEKEFNIKGRLHKDRRSHTPYTKVFSKNISRYLNKVLSVPIGDKAGKISLPNKILSLPKEDIAILLKALYDCDGYVAKDHRELEYSTKSSVFAQQIQLLLSRFGIISYKKQKYVNEVPYYSVFINGSSCNLYYNQIGFTHPEKQRKLDVLTNKEYIETTNIDSIPYGNLILKELRQRLRVSPYEIRQATGKDYWAYENNAYHVSSHWFKKLVSFYERRYESLLQEDLTALYDLKHLLGARKQYIKSLKELTQLLGISQEDIKNYLGDSPRNSFAQSDIYFIDTMYSFKDLIPLIHEKSLKLLRPSEESLDSFMKDVNLSYAEVARDLGYNESSIHYYKTKTIDQTNPRLAAYFKNFKEKKLMDIHRKFIPLYHRVLMQSTLMKKVEIEPCLKKLKQLKETFHIKNEDYNVSVMTVSNFFTGKYEQTNTDTLYELTKKTLDIYESAKGNEVREILKEAKKISSDDLFWDEIIDIKKIASNQEWVYDLTVEETHNFIANGTIVHNSSFLGGLLLEIMRKYRIITVEDTLELNTDAMRKLGYNIQPLKVRAALVKSGSEVPADEGIRTSLRLGDSALIVGEVRSSIRGNEEVFVVDKGKAERVAIKDLEGRELSEMYVPTMDRDLKFKLKKVIAFVKHPKREKLLEVTTNTGRKVTVTPDHSLFTQNEFRIVPIECKDLVVGSKIVIPEKIPCGYNNLKKINIMELLEDKGCRLEGYEKDLRQIIQKIGCKKASEIANTSADIYVYLRKGIQHSNIPISTFKQLAREANHEYTISTFQIKKGTSKTVGAEIEISKDFCRFLGYYASEGYTQKETSVVVFSNGNPRIVNDIITLSKNLFNINPFIRKTESLGISTQISLSNKVLGLILTKLGCGRVATEKRVPSFIFGLSEDKICEFLKGYFDGDGCQLASESSGNEISASTVSKDLADDIMHLLLCLGIVARVEKGTMSDIGKHPAYVVVFKQRKYIKIFLEKVAFKKYTKNIIERQTSHSIFNTVDYEPKILEEHVKIKRAYRHLRRSHSCGKEYLKNMVNGAEWASERIKTFANGEFYLDEIKEIKEVNLEQGEYVYDLSVEPCQNFLGGFGGIMLHNTEALALFEAMRIGASANVVAGTIHADSPYGIFDRIANDLKVPRTSFKATDVIIICNPIQTAGGMKRVRRCLQITEVRKHWEEDPVLEGGFADLMRYNAKIDKLEPTPELMNGESEILKNIAANVKEWVGNWDAIWENIVLRGELKQMLVDNSIKFKMPELLEAEFSLQGNDTFNRISESVQKEVGAQDAKRIKEEWEEWLKREIRKKQLG